ncbi:SubName: Full=Uncharacterized protein {ECO:0000313/EMBL:CCA75174.1} [Serendipita indica DSM 11827]|nr:SubName: Full=Uncharacterized protein {ECO:0000313/EMBL:CCA75174.1} [Serendipita indica DSM 11827]
MANPPLTVEIWQKILRHAIFVPVFLDSDPVETYGTEALPYFHDEGPYWEAERGRNSLRRVFWAWNLYLRAYDNRYIRLSDVARLCVPAIALSRAIRISVANCYTSHFPTLSAIEDSVESKPEPWQMEILDGRCVASMDVIQFLTMPHRISNIRAEINGVPILYEALAKNQSPVTFLGNTRYTTLPWQSFNLRHTTTMMIAISGDWEHPFLDMPKLRHLQICTFLGDRNYQKVFRWLKVIGGQLRTLYWKGRECPVPLDPNIWEMCPAVEVLEMPCDWRYQPPPPANHPIRALRVDMRRIYHTAEEFCHIRGHFHPSLRPGVPLNVLEKANIRTLANTEHWLEEREGGSNRTLIDAIFCLRNQADKQGIALVDLKWRTYEEFSRLRFGLKPQTPYII